MNIQNRVAQILKLVVSAEQELEALRQLISEQIEFTISNSFRQMFMFSHSSRIDLSAMKLFLKDNPQSQLIQQISDSAIQSVIKFYSNNQLHINMEQWMRIVLTREDLLLAKITKEREQNVDLPNYIINYCKKLLIKECLLHKNIIKLRSNSNKSIIAMMIEDQQISQQKFGQVCCNLFEKYDHEHSESKSQIFARYVKQGLFHNSVTLENIQNLLICSNSQSIHFYLAKKQQQLVEKPIPKKNNPFIHKGFSRLIKKQNGSMFSYRQALSIQTHIGRNKILPTSDDISIKIKQFSNKIQEQLSYYFKSLKKLIKFAAKIDKIKVELLRTKKCNFPLFFKEITKSHSLIPSQLLHYLQNFQIQLPLSSIFSMVKRYCDPITGQLSMNMFCKIFKSPNVGKIESYPTLTLQFRKCAIVCLLNEVQYEQKIEQTKRKMMNNLDLRQIFDILDEDCDGLLSQTDFRVVCKKITSYDLFPQELRLFWFRFGTINQNQLISYDKFILEMLPRKPEKKSTHIRK